MATLRKLVIRIRMLGARESIVSNKRSCREKATSWPLSGFLMVRSIKGTPTFVGGAGISMVPGVAIPGNGGAGGGIWASAFHGIAINKKMDTRIKPRRARNNIFTSKPP